MRSCHMRGVRQIYLRESVTLSHNEIYRLVTESGLPVEGANKLVLTWVGIAACGEQDIVRVDHVRDIQSIS